MTTHPMTPGPGTVTMYSTGWCPYCTRLRAQLDSAGLAYTEIDVDADAEAASFVESVNAGNRVVPTVVFPNGSTMTNPTGDEVAHALSGA